RTTIDGSKSCRSTVAARYGFLPVGPSRATLHPRNRGTHVLLSTDSAKRPGTAGTAPARHREETPMQTQATEAGAQELHADTLIDLATELQNEGRYGEAEAVLAEAERLLDNAQAELDALGVPRLEA